MSHYESSVKPFFKDKDFDYELRVLLGQVVFGGADAGEVLVTAAVIKDGDTRSWIDAWVALGDRIAGLAEGSAQAGHIASAASAWLRAANYYGKAINALASLPDTDELVPVYHKHRAAWDAFADARGFERVVIPYRGGGLPGYFARVSGEASATPAPTLVLVNGSDGPISDLYGSAGAAAADRGYNVLYFDGPGQQSQLFDEKTAFRPDWEVVLTPVVDFLLSRDDVDPDALAVYGVSQAGYWVPRALAFEHRLAAAIADPGVVDVSSSWLDHLPSPLRKLLDEGELVKFNRYMKLGIGHSASERAVWNFRARPYGTEDYYSTYTAVEKYRLTAEQAGDITTPLLITSPEGEQFWPGQSQRLADMVADSTLVEFTAAEGADLHCQPMARALTAERLFDWLDSRLGR